LIIYVTISKIFWTLFANPPFDWQHNHAKDFDFVKLWFL
jgi:predicted RNA methylase